MGHAAQGVSELKLAIISSRYWPETSPGAKRAADLAASLQSAGHRVTVLTQLPNYPDPAAFEYRLPEGESVLVEEDEAGSATWRFAPKVASKDNLAGRLAYEARFALLASRARTRLSDLDGVVASTPFTFNLLAARSYRVPMWLDLRDLTWEYAHVLGRRSWPQRAGANLLRSLALSNFRAARGVSTTSKAQRQYLIDRGVPAQKVQVVPNGVPRIVIEDLTRRSAAAACRADGPVRVVYAGLLGFPQGLEFAVEAMEEMAHEGVELHLFGEGVDRQKLDEYCRVRSLRHVVVHGHIPYESYLQTIATADVLLASLRPEVQGAMPSKILEYMAAGKAILFVGPGEGAEVVGKAGAGVAIPYGDKHLFQERLRELVRDPALRRQLGATGREWVERHRVREQINEAWVHAIQEAFQGRKKPSGRGGLAASSPSLFSGRGKPLGRLASAAARAAELSGFLRLLEWTRDDSTNRLRVLTYHRVTEPDVLPRPCPGSVSATPAEFALQMEFLAASYRVVSIQEVLDAVRNERPLPSRAVLISFDDAYRDFADHAWPILKRTGLPVTLFVPTAFPDHPECTFWWDRLFQAIAMATAGRVETPLGSSPLTTHAERSQCFRRLRDGIKEMPHRIAMELVDRICRELGNGHPAPGVLSWSELRSLAGEGVALGAHTRSHPVVNQISLEEIRSEVSGSIEDLKRQVGSALPIFAYPSGRYNDQAVRVVAEAAIVLAFTTDRGVNDLRHSDRLRLRRIQVGSCTSRALLRSQLLGIRPPSWLKK